MRTIVGLSVFAALFIGTPDAACMHYGARMTVRGILTRQVFPGPPGYESIARGDTPEIYYVMEVHPPTCVTGSNSDPYEQDVKKLANIQLLLTGRDQYVLLEHMLGKRISVSGSLVAAHTGHHHAPVLLSDVQLEAN